jgi:hypothetical protein
MIWTYDPLTACVYDETHSVARVTPLRDRATLDKHGSLIAAAPEMLAALRLAATRRLPEEILADVDSAIAKAEGRPLL